MSIFCYIEDDDKTKQYVKLTISALKENKPLIKIDNEIQTMEIMSHCERSNEWDKNKEMCNWISYNAEPFRTYLNTVKLLALFMIVEKKDIGNLNKSEFDELRCKINDNGKLLDYIFT